MQYAVNQTGLGTVAEVYSTKFHYKVVYTLDSVLGYVLEDIGRVVCRLPGSKINIIIKSKKLYKWSYKTGRFRII